MEIIDRIFHDTNEVCGYIRKRARDHDHQEENSALFFTTEGFSDIVDQSIKEGREIDHDLIIKVNDMWCVKGEHSALHMALGVSTDNPLIILKASHVKVPKGIFQDIICYLVQKAESGEERIKALLDKIANSREILELE